MWVEAPLHPFVVHHLWVEVSVPITGNLLPSGIQQCHPEVTTSGHAAHLIVGQPSSHKPLVILLALLTVQRRCIPVPTNLILCLAITHPEERDLGLILKPVEPPRRVEVAKNLRPLVVHPASGSPVNHRGPGNGIPVLHFDVILPVREHAVPSNIASLLPRAVGLGAAVVAFPWAAALAPPFPSIDGNLVRILVPKVFGSRPARAWSLQESTKGILKGLQKRQGEREVPAAV
mmetsp:Transcript_12370/g.34738  ORF Transcript_12370/g.34738 Transcript_12370/m.34738 type:complete len:232 (+) Transcript_12370:1917-2612(+)